MWTLRFALALATLIEGGDGTEAQLLLEAMVVSACIRLRMPDDAGDVLQNTWIAILELARAHTTAPRIAKQIKAIIHNKAVNIIRARERVRKLDALWESTQAAEPSVGSIDDLNIDEELTILLARLRQDHPQQYDAVNLSLHCANHEEARAKWQNLHAKQITADNFRQMHYRGTQKLRRYWEQTND